MKKLLFSIVLVFCMAFSLSVGNTEPCIKTSSGAELFVNSSNAP